MSNVMEVITKGRYDTTVDPEAEPMPYCSSSSNSTRTESQLSLEYLPPEAPYYGSLSTVSGDSDHSDVVELEEEEVPKTATNQLYQKIQALSSQIHSELDTMIDIESVSSHQPTPVPTDAHLVREPLEEFDLVGQPSTQSETELNECRDLMCVAESEDGSFLVDSTLTPRGSESATGSVGVDSFSHADPKLKKALDKMKRLDEKLADLDKKEKEVKRQRKLLEQQMETDSKTDLQTTSAHSLDRELYSPVFATQLNDNSSTAGDSTSAKARDSAEGNTKASKANSETLEEKEDTKTKSKTQVEITGTNFIKRNIELASDAGALVAMTEAEKGRLEQLLGGEEESEDDPNANTLSVYVGEDYQGFSHKQKDQDRMREIDSQLQAILPPSDWESISCSSRIDTTTTPDTQAVYSRDTLIDEDSDEGEVDKERQIVPGEEVLHQFQMSRSERERMKNIDDRLTAIQQANQLTLPLPSSDLQVLLNQYHTQQATSHTYTTDCEQQTEDSDLPTDS